MDNDKESGRSADSECSKQTIAKEIGRGSVSRETDHHPRLASPTSKATQFKSSIMDYKTCRELQSNLSSSSSGQTSGAIGGPQKLQQKQQPKIDLIYHSSFKNIRNNNNNSNKNNSNELSDDSTSNSDAMIADSPATELHKDKNQNFYMRQQQQQAETVAPLQQSSMLVQRMPIRRCQDQSPKCVGARMYRFAAKPQSQNQYSNRIGSKFRLGILVKGNASACHPEWSTCIAPIEMMREKAPLQRPKPPNFGNRNNINNNNRSNNNNNNNSNIDNFCGPSPMQVSIAAPVNSGAAPKIVSTPAPEVNRQKKLAPTKWALLIKAKSGKQQQQQQQQQQQCNPSPKNDPFAHKIGPASNFEQMHLSETKKFTVNNFYNLFGTDKKISKNNDGKNANFKVEDSKKEDINRVGRSMTKIKLPTIYSNKSSSQNQ